MSNKKNILQDTKDAVRVILVEANVLHQMEGNLPSNFAGAVEMILQTKGRVIGSGAGKLGHIGKCTMLLKKIANAGNAETMLCERKTFSGYNTVSNGFCELKLWAKQDKS